MVPALRHPLLALGFAVLANGYDFFKRKLPNGDKVRRNGQAWPGVGHVQASGGPSAKNAFGRDFKDAGNRWTAALCRLDSDGDGQTNGEELGDPSCTWSTGTVPARTTDISHPGYADSTTSSLVPGQQSTATTAPTPATPAPAAAPAPAASPAPSPVGSASGIVLTGHDGDHGHGIVQLSFQAVGQDSVEFTARLDRGAWLGIGISAGDAMSMTGGGQGSDVVACTDGQVRRYWVTSHHVQLNSYELVPGSTCTQANGATTMTFVRKVAAENNRQRALTPGTFQQVIYAYGSDGGISMGNHGGRRGSKNLDFGSGASKESKKRSGPALLYLHLALMSLAWAGLLPFGVAAANRLKGVPGAPTGAWFRVHMRAQVVGWCLQLLGFGAAIWYVQDHSIHFHSVHAWLGLYVVVTCTLQPLNAMLRPHPSEPKSTGRIVWEVIHKGLGWASVVLGLVNIVFGIAHAANHDFDSAVVGTASGLTVVCALPVAVFFVLALARPDNAISRWLVGAGKTDNQDP